MSGAGPPSAGPAPSVIFAWKRADYELLLRTCEGDEVTPYLFRHLPRDGRVLEVGCGLGRFVKFLADRGYDVEGIEYAAETVRLLQEIAPGLPVRQGDALRLPYGDGAVGGIVSLGVIEHFFEGCEAPLREMYRVLRPGGIAVLTVPSQNRIRQLKRALRLEEANYWLNPKQWARRSDLARRLLGRRRLPPRTPRRPGRYATHPAIGEFFEYRLRPEEFEGVLGACGFEILESVPIGCLDGVYHEFGRLLVRFRGWRLEPNAAGRLVNRALSRRPFVHNHMHLCVVRRPATPDAAT